MCETWALGSQTNSEFNLFFKASTVTSLQTTTASRTPSDKSEYIFTLLYSLICLHAKHLGILMNSLKRLRAFQIELEFGLKC